MFRFSLRLLIAWSIAWCLETGGCLLYIHYLRGGFTASGFTPFVDLLNTQGRPVIGNFALHSLVECLVIAAFLTFPTAGRPLALRPAWSWIAAVPVAALSIFMQVSLGRLSLAGELLESIIPVAVITLGCIAFTYIYSILSCRAAVRRTRPAIGTMPRRLPTGPFRA